jgi:sialic acid synthase SpsE
VGQDRSGPPRRACRVLFQSLLAAWVIRAGEALAGEVVAVKRPGSGISLAELDRAPGRRVRRDLALEWEALGGQGVALVSVCHSTIPRRGR